MGIQPFDSFDELMEHMRRQMDAADARVKPWQARIKAGDYFRRSSRYGINIYGEVLPDDEPREEHVRHYRLCRCYSIACVDGELGDVHVSTIEALLNKDEFKAARERGWNP